MLPCDICSKTGHPWFDCPDRAKRPVEWKPARLTKSTAARKDVQGAVPPELAGPEKAQRGARSSLPEAGTQAPPVDTLRKATEQIIKRGRGRPKSISDMKAYKADKERKRRLKAKAAHG